MVKIQQSQSNPSSYFELGGVDYKKGLYIPFYLSIERGASGKINQKKIKVGLKHSENETIIQEAVTVSSYVNSSDTPYTTLKDLLTDLLTLVTGSSSGGGSFDAASLPNSEVVTIANLLASLPNGYIEYYSNQIADNEFKILIESSADDQVITIAGENNNNPKQYFIGDAPYKIKVAEDFPTEGLGATEYYHIYWQVTNNYDIQRLIGNNLPTLPQGFNFGDLESQRFYFQVYKSNQGQVITIVNTDVTFNNNTNEQIRYRLEADNWGIPYTDEPSITTDHYNRWDYLYPRYEIDLSDSSQSVKFDAYNDDTGQLLRTATAQAGQNYTDLWGGGLNAVRNVRIEVNYV